MPRRKRVLITGGAGFIGSNLALRLASEGNDVEILDNMYTGCHENVEWVNYNTSNRVRLIVGDVTEEITGLARYDEVYHLACPASPPHYQKDPFFTIDTCVRGTSNILKAAQGRRVRVLIASTSEVYGDPEVSPQTEQYRGNVNPFGPRACYDEGKRMAETLAYEYSRRDTDVRVARIFNTYGVRMDPEDGRVVSNFINQALDGKPLTVYGNGEQTRSICYVTDTLNGLIKLMASDVKTPTNIGNPVEMRIIDIARMIGERVLGSRDKIRYEHMPLPEDDPKQRRPDIEKAGQLLHWKPICTPEEGIDATIAYFREVRAGRISTR